MVQRRGQHVKVRNPYTTDHSDNVGDRIPHSDKVQPGDPARTEILLTINQMVEAGVELDGRAIEIATQLGRWHRDLGVARRAEMEQGALAEPAPTAQPDSWVYYLRCGNLIKIGTTTKPAARFSSIRPNEVLAIEPGGHALEAERHRVFRQLRASGEYFHPGPALQQQVLAVRSAYGVPTITSSIVPDGQDWFPTGVLSPAET